MGSMISKLRKFMAFTRSEKILFLQAVFVLPVISWLLRVISVSRLCRWIESSSKNVPAADMGVIASTCHMLDSAARVAFPPYTCLEKSLALRWLLLQRGISTSLHFGIRNGHGLDGHAWLEYGGVPIHDSPDVRKEYAAFAIRSQ